jgi:hypothetical protein
MGFGYDPVDSAAYAIPKSKNHMNIQKQQDPDTVDTPLEFGKFVFFSFIIILAAMLGLYIYRFGITTSTSQSTWGAFGDFIGGILNPLVSFFTLIVAVSVWKLQRLQLAATKKELEETREAIKIQTFDQFFMSVLASHRAMSEQVSLVDQAESTTIQTGKRAIDSYRKYLTRFEYKFKEALNKSPRRATPVQYS